MVKSRALINTWEAHAFLQILDKDKCDLQRQTLYDGLKHFIA